MLDAEPLQGTPDLGRVLRTRAAIGAARTDGPAGAIGVDRLWQPMAGEHRVERGQHGVRGLALAQSCMQQLSRRVIDHRDQALPLLGPRRQPDVVTAVEVQHLAETGARRPPQEMTATRTPLLHQPGALQRLPHKAVRPHQPMLAARDRTEVSHVEPGVASSIQLQERLEVLRLDQPWRAMAPRPSVDQALDPELLVAPASVVAGCAACSAECRRPGSNSALGSPHASAPRRPSSSAPGRSEPEASRGPPRPRHTTSATLSGGAVTCRLKPDR